jgi:TolB-like protein/DNA-binding winged helix-turn-helix (wHTH) protein
MAMERQLSYQLGTYTLEHSARILRHEQQPVHLTGIPFQVLVYLIENRDRLVSRAELLDRFWEGRDVYEASLTKAVGAIRKALNDPKDQPLFIETRYGEGYRYIGPCVVREPELVLPEPSLAKVPLSGEPIELARTEVQLDIKPHSSNGTLNGTANGWLHQPQTVAVQVPPVTPSANLQWGWRKWFIATLVITALLSTVFAIKLRLFAPQTRSLAVLPLKNLSGDPAQEYLSDGLTEHLINTLAKLEGLKVISRGSAFTFKGQAIDSQEAGKKLGVTAILTGSVLKLGERVRIEVRLVNTADGRVLWASDTSERTLGDIFAVQDEIARRVVAGLKIDLSAEGERRLAKRYTDNIEAYQASLKGDFFRNQRTPEGLKKAIESYQQAIALEPRYLPAYLGLASSYYMGIWYIPLEPQDATAKAKAAQLKALEIDDGSSEAHVALAGLRWLEWDWAGCFKEMTRVKELHPGFSDYGYAYQLLLVAGQPDEAVRWIKRSEELDPLSPLVSANVAEILYYARRYDEAIVQCHKTLGLDPNYAMAHTHLGLAYVQKGTSNEAIAEFQKAITLSARSPDLLGHLGHAYAAAGRREEALRVLAELMELSKQGHVPPYRLAEIHAALGNQDQAFAYLEQAYQAHAMHLCNLKVEPTLDPLRADARFTDLLRRVGLAR